MRLGVYRSKLTNHLRVVTKDKVGTLPDFKLCKYRTDTLTPHNPDQENIMATRHDFLGSLELLDWREE